MIVNGPPSYVLHSFDCFEFTCTTVAIVNDANAQMDNLQEMHVDSKNHTGLPIP